MLELDLPAPGDRGNWAERLIAGIRAVAADRPDGERVSIRAHGAVGNGVANDWPAWVAARAQAGARGTVYLPARPGAAQTVYFFAVNRPDLSGVTIDADPGVVVKLNDENPNTKTLKLMRPVTFVNVAQGISRLKPSNMDLDAMAAFAIAGGAKYEPLDFSAIDFTTGWSVGEYTSSPTWGNSGTWSGTVTKAKLSWSSAFANNAQGAHRIPQIGEAYEFTFETTEDANAAGYVGVMVGSNAPGGLSAEWRFHVGSALIERYRGGVLSARPQAPTGNGPAYRLPLQAAAGRPGAIVLRIAITAFGTAEVYANGALIDRLSVGFAIARVGAFVSAAASAKASIERGVLYRASRPAKRRALKVLVIGDSQAYGAWSALAIENLLPVAFAAIPGGGLIDVTNVSVSGSSAQAWISNGKLVIPNGGGPLDVSSYAYVLINLGTNNVQGGAGQVTLASAVIAITADVRAQGSEPIYSLFPTFAPRSLTGEGVDTFNAYEAAQYRTIITYHCADNGCQIADVNEQFADGIGHYLDNIHPNPRAQALIAIAFAQALARKRGGPDDAETRVIESGWAAIPPAWFSNGYASWGGAPAAPAQYRVRSNGDVEFRGRIAGAMSGAGIAINLPSAVRPSLPSSFVVRTVSNGAEGTGVIAINSAGGLTVNTGLTSTTGTSFAALDGITFSLC